jgi:hypothetical protein
VGQKVCAAALVEIEGVEQALFCGHGDLAAVEIDTLGGRITLEALQLALIAAPLVGDSLATLETADRDNHLGREVAT